jgi:hypothetical protein
MGLTNCAQKNAARASAHARRSDMPRIRNFGQGKVASEKLTEPPTGRKSTRGGATNGQPIRNSGSGNLRSGETIDSFGATASPGMITRICSCARAASAGSARNCSPPGFALTIATRGEPCAVCFASNAMPVLAASMMTPSACGRRSPTWSVRAARGKLVASRAARLERLPIRTAIGDSDLINVRFGPRCGLKSDISRGPRSANGSRAADRAVVCC